MNRPFLWLHWTNIRARDEGGPFALADQGCKVLTLIFNVQYRSEYWGEGTRANPSLLCLSIESIASPPTVVYRIKALFAPGRLVFPRNLADVRWGNPLPLLLFSESSMDSTPIIEEEESALILKELKEISNKHSSYLHQSSKPTASSSPKLQPLDSTRSAGKENNKDAGKDELDDSFIDDATTFLNKTSENRELNQYWYSKSTIETLCNAIRESIDICGGRRVAFLSTPSLFFSLTKDERDHCALLDVSLQALRFCLVYLAMLAISLLLFLLYFSLIPLGSQARVIISTTLTTPKALKSTSEVHSTWLW